MKSRYLIQQRLLEEVDPSKIEALEWVLLSPECPICNHRDRKDLEVRLFRQEITPSFLEQKSGWASGIVDEHMSHHIDADPEEEKHIEKMREESVNTLNVAENLLQRCCNYLDEWEDQRQGMPIDEDWIMTATRIVAEANRGLKLVGQLKQEIGVDSQLLLAERRMNLLMTGIVDVLKDEPQLLDQIEFRIAALKPATIDVEYEVLD